VNIERKELNMKTNNVAIFPLIFCLFCSCSTSIATYDQYSYSQNSSLKVEVLKLVEKSSEPYYDHQAAIEKVVTDVQKAMEYDIHKPKNAMMARMWNILWKRIQSEEKKKLVRDSVKVGFFPFWRENGSTSPMFAIEARIQISEMFDTILDLEAGKIRESDVHTNKLENYLGK